MIAHWDEVAPEHVDNGVLGFDRYNLGEAAGTVEVGVKRVKVLPHRQSSPVHVEVAEEEIFFVLGGTGLLWQNGAAHEVRAGDCIVHRVGEEEHTLIGGDDGLDVLAFGERADPVVTWLPRPRVASMDRVSLQVAHIDESEFEAEQGALALPAPSPRPHNVVNVDEAIVYPLTDAFSRWRNLGEAAGSARTGLKHVSVPAGQLNAPPHCHSDEEEIFVVLEGDGTLELTPTPHARAKGGEDAQHPVRAGDVISRPGGTRVAHAFRAGDAGMTLLAYGQKRSNDITYYPRSNKIFFRGVGLIARLDHLAYEVGEESPY